MARILLLNPSPVEQEKRFIPYALLYLRSALERHGHTVRIIDFQMGRQAYEGFKAELSQRPDVLGVSLFCGPAVPLAKMASALCRKMSASTRIVWGGVLPTIAPEMVLRDAEADYVLRFEAEDSLPKLVAALEAGRDPRDVPNVAYLDGDEVSLKPPAPVLDLSDFAPIHFNDVDGAQYVIKNLGFGTRVAPIFTSRGCPYACTFCYNRFCNQGKWRPFPTEWTLETVDKLVETFGINSLLALDDNFFVERDRAWDIFQGVRSRGHVLNWWTEMRVDQILEMTPKDLRELYDLGVREVYVGAESGADRILKLLNKRITADDTRNANRMLAEADFIARYSFILCAPTEIRAETLQTIDLAMELLDTNPKAALWQFNRYVPYPGTPLYKFAVKHGYKPYTHLDDWNIGWTTSPGMLPSPTLSGGKYSTVSYGGLFQASDEAIKNRPPFFRAVFRIFRSIFRFRLRRHVFAPFLDTWTVAAFYKCMFFINRRRMAKLSKHLAVTDG